MRGLAGLRMVVEKLSAQGFGLMLTEAFSEIVVQDSAKSAAHRHDANRVRHPVTGNETQAEQAFYCVFAVRCFSGRCGGDGIL